MMLNNKYQKFAKRKTKTMNQSEVSFCDHVIRRRKSIRTVI